MHKVQIYRFYCWNTNVLTSSNTSTFLIYTHSNLTISRMHPLYLKENSFSTISLHITYFIEYS